MTIRKILLVEGSTDKYFVERLISREIPELYQEYKKNTFEIQPKEYKDIFEIQSKGGVNNVMNEVQIILRDLLESSNDTEMRLGIIADADYKNADGKGQKTETGFDKRWESFSKILEHYGYFSDLPKKKLQGTLFQHNDGLNPIGLWLMHSHFEDGYLEKLLLNSIDKNKPITNDVTQGHLLTEVDNAIKNLGAKELKVFKNFREEKAKVFTWLAWQKEPRHFIADVIHYKDPQNDLIKIDNKNIQALVRWLRQVFV